jgi:hypothetical protein
MRHMRGVRPIVVDLLFFGLRALAETPADNDLSKPPLVQDAQSAHAFITFRRRTRALNRLPLQGKSPKNILTQGSAKPPPLG